MYSWFSFKMSNIVIQYFCNFKWSMPVYTKHFSHV